MAWLPVMLLWLAVASNAGVAQGSEREPKYGPDPNQGLDLSLPTGKRFPTVIFVHGGSLTSGDKADEDYCACDTGVGKGCAHLSIARLGLKTSDLRGVIPMGSIMWDDELEQALKQYGRSRVEESFRRDSDNRIYGSLDTYLEHWPIRHVRAGLPPFLFLIAESEKEQPPVLRTDMKFVEDSRALGNWAQYRVLPGRTHYSAIRNLSKPGDVVFSIVRDFVRQFSGDHRE